MQIPQMTVVLMVGKQRERGTRCLQSILAQTVIDQLEVLLLDNEVGTEAPLSGSTHPSVRLMALPPVKSYGEGIVYGIDQARAPVVALIEEHTNLLPGWAAALIQAHQGPYAAVSGEIHNANPGHGVSDLVYCVYLAMTPPRVRGETTDLIGQNSSYKRDILLKYGSELIDLFQNDILLRWRLQQDGYKFFSEPEAKFAHANETYLRSHWVGIYLSNQAFGAARARTHHWSLMKRALYVLIVPAAPWIRLARQISILRKERPKLLPLTLRNVSILWTIHAAAVIGQAVGLIWGAGGAGERFLDFELNEYRYVEGINVLKVFTPIRG